MPQQPINVIIVDDHEIMREGLRDLLGDEKDIHVTALADNGHAAINLAHHHQPDILILDIKMPDMTGLEALWQLRQELPDIKVIILTMYEEEAFFLEALRAGASGYFLKGSHSSELIHAIKVVQKGEVYLPPKLTGCLVKEYLTQYHQLQELGYADSHVTR
ncbi:MAG: response regulator transcription factor [Ardenticatenaceae bacterium]|nr:response regulator transcription factor [Ardenticatenaceae bacterium]